MAAMTKWKLWEIGSVSKKNSEKNIHPCVQSLAITITQFKPRPVGSNPTSCQHWNNLNFFSSDY